MNLNQVTITTDHWTSRANESYMSETLHYLARLCPKETHIGSVPIQREHTAVNIAKALDNTLSNPELLRETPNKLCAVD